MWDHLENLPESDRIEAVAINPTLVVGPSLSDDMGTSNMFIQKMLEGSYPAAPKIHFGFVTVEDTARAHIEAMLNPNASGKRFILSEKNMWLREMNQVLVDNGYTKAPLKQLPDFLIKFLGLFNKELSVISGFVGRTKFTNSENAKNILDFKFEGVDNAIINTAKKFEELGIIKK